VRCDPERIQQLASNLLGNAMTHGAAQEEVRFDARMIGADLLLEVWNGGEPIAEDVMAKVFAPFWRRTAAREGLGLGLYICAQIVKSHRGTLEATSTRKGGTLFTARLPIGA
jgi:signal transduction histidine kinase